MADIEDERTQQLLRGIVRDEARKIVREETRKIVREETREIVQEETADMRADIKAIKIDVSAVREVQGGQSLKLQSLQAGMGSLKNSFRGQQREMHRLGGLFEDLDNRFAAVSEVQ